MRRLPTLILLAALPAGCSLYFETSADQCASDGDCPSAGTTCDLQARLCVPADPAPNATGFAGAEPARASSPPASVQPSPERAPRDGGAPVDGRPPPDASLPDARPSPDASVPEALAEDPCARTSKPRVRLAGAIDRARRLTCDSDYLLEGVVQVGPGAVLTIDPGTTVLGDVGSRGRLVVLPGGRLEASGLRYAPIVFTSAAPLGSRRPGDWGGLTLLGRATTHATRPYLDGVGPRATYGGTDDEDGSGILRFVRLEYAGRTGGYQTAAGLTLAGVGRGTTLDHVQVRQSADDCFGFLGGTVNGRHLVCQQNGADGFDWQQGYRGKLQFLIVQQSPQGDGEHSGLEAENDPNGSRPPATAPTVYNVTLCGAGRDRPGEHYGILLRRGAGAHLSNLVMAGFEAGIDLRGMTTELDLRSALFANPVAYREDWSNATTRADDDHGRDELALFREPERRNREGDPGLADCFDPNRFGLSPEAALLQDATPPPDDGFFDPGAAYLGAVRDNQDTWTGGGWMIWSSR
jgi:hypothetical protein